MMSKGNKKKEKSLPLLKFSVILEETISPHKSGIIYIEKIKLDNFSGNRNNNEAGKIRWIEKEMAITRMLPTTDTIGSINS